MGSIAYSLLWVMQGLYHQLYESLQGHTNLEPFYSRVHVVLKMV